LIDRRGRLLWAVRGWRRVVDADNIVDKQDHQLAATQLAGRLPVAVAMAAAESKGTTGRKSALRLLKGGASAGRFGGGRYWT
jgi:hypothetical protein